MTWRVARTGNNLPNGEFSPDVWSTTLQKKWYAGSLLPEIVNHDWETDIRKAGQTVYIRKRPDAFIQPYASNQAITWQDVNDEKFSFVVDKSYYAAIKMDTIDLTSMDINLFNELTDEIAKRHMNVEDQYVMTLPALYASTTVDYLGGTGTTDVSSSANYDRMLDLLSRTKIALDRKFIPYEGRFFVMSPEVMHVLTRTSGARFDVSGVPNEGQRYGYIGDLYGFKLLTSTFVAGSGTSGAPWQCFAGTKDAISFARKVTETEANVPLQDHFGRGIKSLNVFGSAVTAPDALVYCKVQTV